eukprot:3932059-Rhodomonas_salina.1
MERRWEGKPGHPALAHVPRSARRPERTVGEPHTTTYVDDFLSGAWGEWIEELFEVSGEVFRLTGMTEKMGKREKGFELVMLGGVEDPRGEVRGDPGAVAFRAGACATTTVRVVAGTVLARREAYLGLCSGGVWAFLPAEPPASGHRRAGRRAVAPGQGGVLHPAVALHQGFGGVGL